MGTWLMRYWGRLGWLPRLLSVIALLALLAFATWTISPLFYNRRVDEAFPLVRPPLPTSVAAMPPTATVVPLATALPPTSMAAVPTATALPPTPQTTPTPAAPVGLTSGSFTRIDQLHYADGRATIYQLTDGARVLRLEDFSAGNGPDLFIGLSGHPMPRSHDEVYDQGYIELARLKGNQGNQNYELSAELDLSAFKSVVIYCRAFNVVFSTAELIAPQ